MPPKNFAMGFLMDPAGDGTGTSGDGKAVGLDEKAVNGLINSAFTKFAKETLPNTIKEITTSANKELGDQLKTIAENLGKLQDGIVKPPVDPKDQKIIGDDGLTPEARKRFLDLEKKLTDSTTLLGQEKTKREQAEAASRLDKKNSAIRTALSQFTFQSTDAAEDAFASVSGKVDFNDEGELLADGLLLSDFVTSFIPEKKQYLLKPDDRSGSGALPGKGRGGSSRINIEDITAQNMADPQKAQAVAGAIARALQRDEHGNLKF